MSTSYPTIEDATLGTLSRAETTLDDGGVVTHNWYAGSITVGDHELELMVDGTDIGSVQALLPRIRAVVADLGSIGRRASDAVRAHFSDSEPSADELDAAADDLQLEAIEATADQTVLHLQDTCGEHFPEGYWPAVHLDHTGAVTDVTVES